MRISIAAHKRVKQVLIVLKESAALYGLVKVDHGKTSQVEGNSIAVSHDTPEARDFSA